jgi:hypothetical protein
MQYYKSRQHKTQEVIAQFDRARMALREFQPDIDHEGIFVDARAHLRSPRIAQAEIEQASATIHHTAWGALKPACDRSRGKYAKSR